MRVLISGASGFVGTAVQAESRSRGWEVVRLVRRPASSSDIRWDPQAGLLAPSDLKGFDAVIHLAGESIQAMRWTAAKKQRIRQSRILGTELLAEAIADLKSPPRVLVSASGVGYYGDRGAEELSEESGKGRGFLADLAAEWEGATAPAARAGVRVACIRIGLVLGRDGGALPRMMLPFRMGLGGRLGRGHQFMSWIAISDLVGAIAHIVESVEIRGAVNAVSPEPVTNREFTKALAAAVSRPAIFPVPEFLIRAGLGEMGRELLLSSTRALPRVLQRTGFQFRYPSLSSALRECVGRG